MNPEMIVKVGGSLFDLPDLGVRLTRWLDQSAPARALLVPGGGAAADIVRALDRLHKLGEERAHWLALRAMSFQAHVLATLLSHSTVIERCADWSQHARPILDAHAFATEDENRPGALPHSWAVTSDAIAARVAVVTEAPLLVLLKSASIPEGLTWEEAARRGYVDDAFPNVVRQATRTLEVRALNLREWRY